ncbi:hypothetical protein K0U00_17810, partial [Paenibacillus sepulcri]|nr:hypothetical protein [Paenibacillus sepulcri]
LHWNLAAETVFNLSQIPGPHSRNMLWRAFAMPELMKNPNWSKMAQGLVAQFRADYALYPGDPWFEELKHDLEEASPDFVRFWSEHQVMEMPDCHKEFNHPELGDLEFEYAAFQVTTVTGMKLAVYTASPATAVKLAGDGTSAGPPQSVLYPLTASDRGDGLS